MLNSADKRNNLEILTLWILPLVTTLVKYKINTSQLSHRLIVASTGTPFPIPFPLHIKMVHLQCLNY